MFIKTNLGSAYIHNYDLLDNDKEIVLFIPGAGMDHRVADLISLNPKVLSSSDKKLSTFFLSFVK